MIVLGRIFTVLVLIVYVALISLPGIGISYLGWRLSGNLRPVWVQAMLRGGLLAAAVTRRYTDRYSVYGHGGILPAIFVALVLKGRDRLVGIIPILIVWAVAFPVLIWRAGRRNAVTP